MFTDNMSLCNQCQFAPSLFVRLILNLWTEWPVKKWLIVLFLGCDLSLKLHSSQNTSFLLFLQSNVGASLCRGMSVQILTLEAVFHMGSQHYMFTSTYTFSTHCYDVMTCVCSC